MKTVFHLIELLQFTYFFKNIHSKLEVDLEKKEKIILYLV